MAYILSIDTATKVCSVAIHESGKLIGQQAYHLQKSHSSLLPEIIRQVLVSSGLSLIDLNAIAVSKGPGSYTGLRIGTATAKGMAFALGLPLIAVSSLDSMLEQVMNFYSSPALLCPMIDARRMEVYCKLTDQNGSEIWATKPVIVDENTFEPFADQNLVLFGNGAEKFKEFFTADNFIFLKEIHPEASHMGRLAFHKYQKNDTVDLAYFEPDYLKEFRTNVPTQKLKM